MKNDMYYVNEYTEKELYDILDMNSPTDRELEAKIVFLIKLMGLIFVAILDFLVASRKKN